MLRHGLPGPTAPGVSPDVARQIEQMAAEAQTELALLSTRGRLITAERSGHDIHIDQPELVVVAIRQVVELARGRDA